jgi:hypothetical protein
MTGRLLVAVAAAWLSAVVLSARADGDIRVTAVVADGQVFASFTAPTTFTDETREVLKSGLLLTFRFAVTLRRPNGFWWDPTLRDVTVATTVKFDNLTGAYQVSKLVDEHVVWSDRTMDLAQVRAWTTTFERIPLVPSSTLQPNVDYYIQVRMWASPRRTFPLWPWSGEDGAGRASFTNIR